MLQGRDQSFWLFRTYTFVTENLTRSAWGKAMVRGRSGVFAALDRCWESAAIEAGPLGAFARLRVTGKHSSATGPWGSFRKGKGAVSSKAFLLQKRNLPTF